MLQLTERGQRVESRGEQGERSREQGARSKEQGAGSKEQGAGSREQTSNAAVAHCQRRCRPTMGLAPLLNTMAQWHIERHFIFN
jgi:hypothetical protein